MKAVQAGQGPGRPFRAGESGQDTGRLGPFDNLVAVGPESPQHKRLIPVLSGQIGRTAHEILE